MGIKVNSSLAQPAIEFNKVHVLRLQITQPVFTNNAYTPVYKVFIEYRLYGVDDNDKRHYHPETREVEITDFISKATRMAEEGDLTLFKVLGTLESAIAYIISHEEQINAEVV